MLECMSYLMTRNWLIRKYSEQELKETEQLFFIYFSCSCEQFTFVNSILRKEIFRSNYEKKSFAVTAKSTNRYACCGSQPLEINICVLYVRVENLTYYYYFTLLSYLLTEYNIRILNIDIFYTILPLSHPVTCCSLLGYTFSLSYFALLMVKVCVGYTARVSCA